MAERTLPARMIGAAFFSIDTYEEVERDPSLTGQAALVVFLAAVAAALGAAGAGLMSALGIGLAALVGWLVWAGVTYVIGDKLLGGTATWGEMLRTIGFAHAPGVLMILAAIPLLGWGVDVVVGIWMLVTGFIAVRQALDFGNGKTFVTVFLGWLAMGLLRAIFTV